MWASPTRIGFSLADRGRDLKRPRIADANNGGETPRAEIGEPDIPGSWSPLSTSG